MIQFTTSVNRPTPRLGPQYFKTYEVSRPRATHFRRATCDEVECPNYQRGWVTEIDSTTVLGQKQLSYIRMKSGRAFANLSTLDSPIVRLQFAPGQQCFSEHMLPLDREPTFRKLDGDWRAAGDPVILRVADWLDDFGEHQERLAEQRKRGDGQ